MNEQATERVYGRYLVSGKREYRGHPSGTEFIASLDPGPEYRAVKRGDITLLERITPDLPQGCQLPAGWLATTTATEAPEGASLIERGVS